MNCGQRVAPILDVRGDMYIKDEPVVMSLCDTASFWTPAALIFIVSILYTEWRLRDGQGKK